MGKALYRQYRSKKLNEVVGQDHITATLKNAIKSGKISHAYLFTGPKGVGKTSVARILAHEVNGFDYNEQSTHLDIIEIDAASNRRIDEIRDLRDKVHIAPTSGKYKVYIIDEVHMLTKEAFNALLKTLEEPPAHVIFILATTESHKLPDTIVSRTQRYSFKPIENIKIIEHLRNIAKQENIKIDDEALALIAEHSDGSLRDSLSLLDQASSMGTEVKVDDVRQLLGIAPQDAINQLINNLQSSDAKVVLDNLTALEEQGFHAAAIAKQLGETIRFRLTDGDLGLDSADALSILNKLIAVPASPSPDKLLEVILLEQVFHNRPPAAKPALVAKPTINQVKSTDDVIPSRDESRPLSKAEGSVEKIKVDSKRDVSTPLGSTQDDKGMSKSTTDFSIDDWPRVLDNLKVSHNTLYGILRMGQPSIQDGKLVLSFKFVFHQKRINEPRMLNLIANTFESMDLKPIDVVAVVSEVSEEPVTEPEPETNATAKPDMAAISNIFGEAEVLES